MKLKLDDNGNAVLQDGKPVYIHDKDFILKGCLKVFQAAFSD